MPVHSINTDLMDLSVEEQEILSGGKGKKGKIRVDDAVFRYGGEEYPARIRITVSDLPSPDTLPEVEVEVEPEEEEEEEES
ncbi:MULTISPECIES: hypothetical protein [unclassified Nodularia (in: cyanobacteria)]|uniref:hypothetical protein n=1 Tax=unclassified Nodularia (in: cyanobacteria) TaxID=2656917 RepID=UPI001881C24D|nr:MULTISPECIES: hypothetical protein [unclassified Nodularia (in: cyanobacteria)]MBE9199138.1 hypothetical protein [Nodularia sp. LEGE 06071]MCC2695716.1 hypothetical protein [Nodularia sp. LEGE 04288]